MTGIENGFANFIKLKILDSYVLELLEYPNYRTEP